MSSRVTATHLGGLRREWEEEIEADFVPDWRLIGLLNDDATPVGAVHLGLVYEADAAGRPVAIRETHKLRGAFASLAEVEAHRDDLESWSAFALDALRDPRRRHGIIVARKQDP